MVARVHTAIHTLDLLQGKIRYLDSGEGPTLLFIHGIFVNSQLWRNVVPDLSSSFRCIVPDLPLGAHTQPMDPKADLNPLGLAQLIADFMKALELKGVLLIGSDTGGTLCQLVAAHHPQQLSGLVLTNCDAFENFLPPLLRPLQYCFHLPGFAFLMAQMLRTSLGQQMFFWTVAKRHLTQEMADCYFSSYIRIPEVRRDIAKAIRGISNRYTLEAAQHFPDFHKPVLLAWGEDDWFFPVRYAERLKQTFAFARVERIADSRTLVPEDQPAVLVRLIKQFAHEQTST